MPIDPSIALSVKPVQVANPLEQYMQVQQIQQAQNQSRLADLMYGEKRQQITRAQGLRDLSKGWSADTTDEQRATSLRNNAYFDEADKLDTTLQNRAKVKADAAKAQAEAQAKHFDTLKQANGLIGSAAGAIVQNPTYDNAVQVVNGLRQQFGPELSKQYGLDALEIPQDPAQLKTWAQNYYLGSVDTAKQLEDARLKFEGAANRKSQEGIAAGHDATSRANNRDTIAAAKENQKAQYDAARGVLVDTKTGTATAVTGPDGKPLTRDKAMTEFQGKSAGFADRAQEADAILNQLHAKGPTGLLGAVASDRPGALKGIAEAVPFIGEGLGGLVNTLPSALGGPNANQQRAEQAQRNFVNAILRQESGAAIGANEFENARKQYFPQPGDTPEVITQKAANRRTAIAGLARSAGGNYTPPAAGTAGEQTRNQPTVSNW